MAGKSLSSIPSINRILTHFNGKYPRLVLLSFAREEVAVFRKEQMKNRRNPDSKKAFNTITTRLEKRLEDFFCDSIKKSVNATGVILHTGLGRAPLPPAAAEHLQHVSRGYSNLELDLESGERGDRTAHVEKLICMLTGAEAATVVNNNAAAVLISINTLASGKEALISRGELVEIGGSFRMPDVMEKSNARMVEVGTTNKTHARDFEDAITPNTGLILKVHTSNFKVVGFVNAVEGKTLVQIGNNNKVPVVFDLGSGAFVSISGHGVPDEPLVKEAVATGYDAVMFSGDKMLGGPQAGIIAGKKRCIDRIRKNPLMRALRCDKLVYAALESTLKLMLDEPSLPVTHPVFRMLTEPAARVEERARRAAEKLSELPVEVMVTETEARVGSGALPLERIPSRALTVSSPEISANKLAKSLRNSATPVVGYVRGGKVFLDFRTVHDDEVNVVVSAICSMFRSNDRTASP